MKYFTRAYPTMTACQEEQIIDACIKGQFFLAPEMLLLAARHYAIEPILVMSGKTATSYINDLVIGADYGHTLRGELAFSVLHFADYIGISLRTNRITKERHIVYKIWTAFDRPNTNRIDSDNSPATSTN